MRHSRRIGLIALIGLIGVAGVTVYAAEEFAPLFPFLISYDGPDNASSMAHLLDAPAGKHGFIRVKDGRFVTDAGPIRFHATNLTGPANFPAHETSDKLAARLARFGINCVRLHYMDALYGNFMTEKRGGIFGGDPARQRNLDTEQMDRLDYLIAALKRRGIYVDMNLLVARYPRSLESQKEYAKELLTHTNPYTGLAYTDDPCVALIEIKNENGLVYSYYRNGWSDSSPIGFLRQWNKWLRKRYPSSEALTQTWKWATTPLYDEQIPEGTFSQPFLIDDKKWIFALNSAKAVCGASNGVFKIDVVESEDNFPQLYRPLVVKKDRPYTLSFKIRHIGGMEKETVLGLAVADTRKGWRSLGLHREIGVGSAWKALSFAFVAGDDAAHAQLWLTRFKPGSYEIDDLSFKSGSESKIDLVTHFKNGTVPTIRNADFVSVQASLDFCQFLIETERAYWLEMADYLKNVLKAKAVLSGTQACHSPPFIQAELDYVDNHAYWCHPGGDGWLFPVPQAPWHIGNVSMVNSLSALVSMAGQRVHNKPYTISEYNHPYPNQYGAESQVMLAVYGRLQGWDGIFQYSYNHYVDDFEPQANPWCYFDLLARTDALAHFPACAAIFLRGDVREARESVAVAVDLARCSEIIANLGASQGSFGLGSLGVDTRLMAVHKMALDFSGGGMKLATVPKLAAEQKVFVSDTGEITWNQEIPGAAYLAVNTPNIKLFTGFPEGRTIDLGGVKLSVGKTRLNWATVSLASRRATGFGEKGVPASILLAATGDFGNRGRVVKQLSGKKITLTDRGGAPVLAEGIHAEVTMPADPAKIQCYALDPHGDRKAEVPAEKAAGGSKIVIGPQYQTVWYEIEVNSGQ